MPSKDRKRAGPARSGAVQDPGNPDPEASECLQRMVRLAARLLSAPIALVSLEDGDGSYIESAVGLKEPPNFQRETPVSRRIREQLLSDEPLVVRDARGEIRLRESLAGLDAEAVAYLGVPLSLQPDLTSGFLCVLDRQPRSWTPDEIEMLRELAAMGVAETRLRRQVGQQERLQTEAESLTRAIRQGALDAIVMADEAGRIIAFNPAAEAMFGYRAAEVLGRELAEVIVPPALREAHREGFARYRTTGEAGVLGRRIEIEGVRADGTEFPVELTITSVGQHGSRLFTGFLRDVTERRRTEEALRESEGRFRALIEQGWGGVAVLDAQGVVTFASTAVTRHLGYPADEFMGRRVLDYIHPEDLPEASRILSHLVRASGESASTEFRFRHQDGGWRYLEAVGTNLLHDPSVRGIACSFHDITDRKRAETALQESHAVLQAITEGTSDAVYVKDLDGRYLMISSAGAAFIGRNVAEIIGRTDAEFFPQDTVQVILKSDREVLATRKMITREERISSAGVTRTYLTNKGPFLDAQGSALGLIGISRDISDRKATEDALRQSEARFRTICEMAPIGIFLEDSDGNQVFSNENNLLQLGLSREEALGAGWRKALHPEDAERVFMARSEAARKGRPLRVISRFLHADGSVVWREGRLVPLQDGETTTGYVGTSEDITERRRTEEAMLQQKVLLQTILDHIPVMIGVMDQRGCPYFINREWEGVMGWTLEEVRSQDILSVNYPDPAVRQRVVDHLQRADATWADFKTEVRRGRTLVVSWANIRLADGSTIGIGQDVTNRKRVEERTLALQELGRSLNQVGNSEEAARVVLGVADALVGWDSCWIELIDPGRKRSRSVVLMDVVEGERRDVPAPSSDLTSSPTARQALEDGPLLILRDPETMPASQAEMDVPFGDVGRPSASIMCVPIRSGERDVGAMSIQSYSFQAYREDDLTLLQALADYCAGALQRTQAEAARGLLQEQLLQAQKMEAVGRLAGGVAHDFNNMLAVINGYSHLLLAGGDLDASVQSSLQEVKKAGERAAALTRQLLAFSRKSMVAYQVLDLSEIVGGMQPMLRRLIGEHIGLETDLHSGALPVKADRGQVEQIILNLAVNARDAMPQGGRLLILTRGCELDARAASDQAGMAAGAYAELVVSDTGAGMDPEVMAHIWEPFYSTKGESGTGLGLATVYGIVQQHGGFVTVESEPGRGCKFRVLLPKAAGAAVGDVTPEAAGVPHGSGVVLVVEDEAMVRGLVEEVLRMSGYSVLVAGDGEEALRLAAAHSGPIHLLLTDVVMPGGMSGRMVAEALLQLRPDMKVLYMSGYTDDAVVQHGVQHDRMAFIQKPFTPAALVQKLRQLVEHA